jgi:hypothetical protein
MGRSKIASSDFYFLTRMSRDELQLSCEEAGIRGRQEARRFPETEGRFQTFLFDREAICTWFTYTLGRNPDFEEYP